MSYKNVSIDADGRCSALRAPRPVAYPVAHVNIFVAHEKVFVPPAKLLEHISTNHYAETAQDLRPVDFGEEIVSLHVLQPDNPIGDRPNGVPPVLFRRLHELFKPALFGRKRIVVNEADPGRLAHFGETIVSA